MSWKVPFDEDGNQMTYAASWQKCTEVDNYEFSATLRYAGFSRGRSALNITWEDTKTGKLYESGMAMLDEVLFHNQSSMVSGVFTFKKQGTSILLKLIRITL